MSAPDQAETLHRLLGNVARRARDLSDAVHYCQAEDYFDDALHRQEMQVLFRRYPLVVGASSQLAMPGDFITHNHAGVPLLVVRDRGGTLNAFLNVCRHRGAIVETAAAGHKAHAFACPYHAWSYAWDGRLIGVPERDAFAGCDLADRGLVKVPVAERHGLVFVLPSPGAAFDIDAYLGGAGSSLGGLGIARHKLFASEAIAARFNWKIGIDGALEAYHFDVVHPRSAAGFYAAAASGFDDLGMHSRLLVPRRSLTEQSPDAVAGGNVRDHVLVVHFIFPNTLVLCPADHIILFSVFPDRPERSTTVFSILVPEHELGDERRHHWERTTQLSRQVISEDFAIGESIQSACRSGANAAFVYGRCEQGVSSFHRACDRALGRQA